MRLQTLSQPSAILDLRFSPEYGEEDILAVVSSTGTLAIFKLDPGRNPESPLQHISTSRCDDISEEVLFLQCQWHPTDKRVVGVTTSTGALKLLKLNAQWKIEESRGTDKASTLEAWCLAFAERDDDQEEADEDERRDSTIVYCGGDDSILTYTSYVSRAEDDSMPSEDAPFNMSAVKRIHEAGVTAILPLELTDYNGGRLVVTGSYDDHIRLMSIHDPTEPAEALPKPEVLASENLGGGVWRLDLIEASISAGEIELTMLASCMYAGARIVRFGQSSDGKWAVDVLAKFEEHKSMNYGCAVVPDQNESGKIRCLSTSFYDKLLCLWEYDTTS